MSRTGDQSGKLRAPTKRRRFVHEEYYNNQLTVMYISTNRVPADLIPQQKKK